MLRIFTLVLLAVVSLAGRSVHADTVSFSSTVPSISFSSPTSGNVLLRQFDPSLGTLTSVSIGGSLSLTGSGTAPIHCRRAPAPALTLPKRLP